MSRTSRAASAGAELTATSATFAGATSQLAALAVFDDAAGFGGLAGSVAAVALPRAGPVVAAPPIT